MCSEQLEQFGMLQVNSKGLMIHKYHVITLYPTTM